MIETIKQSGKRTDKKIQEIEEVDKDLRDQIDDINDKLEEQMG